MNHGSLLTAVTVGLCLLIGGCGQGKQGKTNTTFTGKGKAVDDLDTESEIEKTQSSGDAISEDPKKETKPNSETEDKEEEEETVSALDMSLIKANFLSTEWAMGNDLDLAEGGTRPAKYFKVFVEDSGSPVDLDGLKLIKADSSEFFWADSTASTPENNLNQLAKTFLRKLTEEFKAAVVDSLSADANYNFDACRATMTQERLIGWGVPALENVRVSGAIFTVKPLAGCGRITKAAYDAALALFTVHAAEIGSLHQIYLLGN